MIRSTGNTLELDGTFAQKAHEKMPAAPTLNDVQRVHIEETLRRCGWKINGLGNAAERLGLHPNTLRFRMKKLGIVSPTQRRAEGMRL
jgi:transcriptional regulator with GAF, ATPase, and Fis domain